MDKRIEAIFFDQGGVLVTDRVCDPDQGVPQIKKIKEILNIDGDELELKKKFLAGEAEYKKWGMDSLIEETPDVIWPRWIFPEYEDKEKLIKYSEELTLLYFRSKGPRFYREGAKAILDELKNRGYKIGLISNTWSMSLVHNELKDNNLETDFDAVILSSHEKKRKPNLDLFHKPADMLGIKYENVAYIGDQPNRDVEGPKKAGYGYTVILKTSKMRKLDNLSPEFTPDTFIDNFEDLLKIF